MLFHNCVGRPNCNLVALYDESKMLINFGVTVLSRLKSMVSISICMFNEIIKFPQFSPSVRVSHIVVHSINHIRLRFKMAR